MILQKMLARRMRTAMAVEHLTIPGVAEKAGIAKSSAQGYLHEKGNPRADTIELICENLGFPLEEPVSNSDQPQKIEAPDFMSMAGSLDHIHPSLIPAVHHSYELAQDILRLSDLLYQLEHRSGGDS